LKNNKPIASLSFGIYIIKSIGNDDIPVEGIKYIAESLKANKVLTSLHFCIIFS